MVEIILRLSSMSTQPLLQSTPPPTQSLSTSLPATPKSTLIFSNSFTSNTLGEQYSPPLSAEQNWSVNSISVTPASPLYALLPSPSFASPSTEARFNLSTPSPLPTDFYLLFKDGYLDNDDQSKVSPAVRDNNNTIDSLTLENTGQAKSPKSIFLKASNNFWSDILTTSLSPQIETLVEYVLIGMLAFVLLQIAIAYLLASEIRTLRTELAMFSAVPANKGRLELEEAEEPHLLAAKGDTKLSDFEKDAYESSAYCELQCFDPSTGTAMPLQAYSSTTAHHSANYGPDFCLLTFQQPIPMVQVHANPDTAAAAAPVAVAAERGNSFNSNYVNVIIDETLSNKPSQFASIVSSSALTSKTNRRNRMGSFRVTFAGESLTENPSTGTEEEEEEERKEKEEGSERHHHSTYYQTVQHVQGTEVHQHQHQHQQQQHQFEQGGQHYQP